VTPRRALGVLLIMVGSALLVVGVWLVRVGLQL
jgi:hypothetical protein